MRQFYLEHLLVGERYVQLYEVDANISGELVRKLKVASTPTSIFSTTYPLPIAASNLPLAPSEPTLAEIRSFSNGDVALVYCSSRYYDEREKQEFNQLSAVVQKIYHGIDELITIRKVFFQAYDVIIIRASLDRIEVCVDQPEKGSMELDKRVLKILAAAASNISELQPTYQSSPINIFPAIRGIFEANKEGSVQQLAFRTLTGSRKFERMVLSTDDLRSEKFHEAGMTAVGHKINPHELVVEWECNWPPMDAALKLFAPVRELSADNPMLFGCFIRASESTSFLEAANKGISD